MLHADQTYEHNPWSASLQDGQTRGLGAELRLLGMNPEEVAERARGMKFDLKRLRRFRLESQFDSLNVLFLRVDLLPSWLLGRIQLRRAS
jgi:hypothetical protein